METRDELGVKQQLRVKRVRLGADRDSGVAMTCVIASESALPHDIPKGEKPVCWRLLTNRAITSLAEAVELIDWYRARWEVEMFFHVLTK